MMSYINETDFVIENKKLVYPEIVADGLQLYYDAKGKRDTDYHRDTMLDMSGNKNHGKLHNFAYEKHSGYKDGLVFDYIDDKLVRPTLDLKPDDFTFMLNGNIISFSPDGTVKRVQDGEVIESKGVNLIRNGDFSEGLKGWSGISNEELIGNKAVINHTGEAQRYIYYPYSRSIGQIVYSSVKLKVISNPQNAGIVHLVNGVSNSLYLPKEGEEVVLSGRELSTTTGGSLNQLTGMVGNSFIIEVSEFISINLTETFGSGKEPTKEQMDEIVQRFGFIPNAQNLIDRIEYKGNILGDMENIIDGLYKTEVLSGEEIYTDKADDAVVHVDVDGKSYQPSYITNLFTKKTVYGDIYSINTGVWLKIIQGHKYYTRRTFTSDSTAGSFGSIRMLGTAPHIFVGNSQMGDYGQITEYTGETRTGEVMFYGSNGAPSGGKIENTFIIDLTSHFGAGNEPSRNEMNKITDALGWFSGNKVYSEWISELRTIPTPDYPIEIHSLNDFDVVSSVGKRNLIALNNMEFGTFNYNTGINSTSNKFKRTINLIPVNPATKYYLWHNLIPIEGTKGIEIAWTFYDKSKSVILGSSHYGESTQITSPVNAHFVKIRIGLNQESWDGDKYLMVKDSTSSWIPAPEDITENDNHPLIDKINLLLGEPLRSVGEVKDRLFRDSDGVWKVERNVGVWDISKDLPTASDGEYFFTYNHRTNRKRQVVSTHFSYNVTGDNSINFSGGGYLRIHGKGMSLGDFGTWLKDLNAKAYYPLDSSKTVIENLNQELQDKLNNLRSFEDSNYVYTVLPNEDNYISENLKPTLHAKFLYNNWYKEDRVINNLMIYNRALTNEEMLQNYKTIKRRWGM